MTLQIPFDLLTGFLAGRQELDLVRSVRFTPG
jgi:hypothetical protein